MDTRNIVSALLFKFPEIRKAFLSLNILSLDRKIAAENKLEFKNILLHFKNPIIISVIGIIQITVLIEPTLLNRVHPVIIIKGDSTEITSWSQTLACKELNSYINIRDFLPQPFVKKIVYISEYKDKLKGVVFSEYNNKIWTTEDPMIIPCVNFKKTSSKEILQEIIGNAMNS